MKRVTGIGGIFFKSKDPQQLTDWYRKHLGIEAEGWNGFAFQWSNDPRAESGSTIWSIFPDSTKYFDPSDRPFMINFRVADLASLLAQLRRPRKPDQCVLSADNPASTGKERRVCDF